MSSANSSTSGRGAGQLAGQGIVVAVLSGDTIEIMGKSDSSVIRPRMTLQIDGITAPRFARGQSHRDEAFAWQSREFLRKLVIGQLVDFQVTYTITLNSGTKKNLAVVTFKGQDLSKVVLAAGWARIRLTRDGKVPNSMQESAQLAEGAEEAQRGVFEQLESEAEEQRAITWNAGMSFFRRFKGKKLDGVVDRVVSGSTLRVECFVPGAPNSESKSKHQHTMVTVNLTGVTCPRVPMSKEQLKRMWERKKQRGETNEEAPTQGEAPEPYALEAQAFVEERLMHQSVKVVLQGTDSQGKFFGTVEFVKGDIAEQLLLQGLGKLVEWSSQMVDPERRRRFQYAEQAAKRAGANLWYSGRGESKSNFVSTQSSTQKVSQPAKKSAPQVSSSSARVQSTESNDSEYPTLGGAGRSTARRFTGKSYSELAQNLSSASMEASREQLRMQEAARRRRAEQAKEGAKEQPENQGPVTSSEFSSVRAVRFGRKFTVPSGPSVTSTQSDRQSYTTVFVHSGDSVTVRPVGANGASQDRRVFLASVRVPRANEPYNLEAREFLRKKLIGARVDVRSEYVRDGANRDGKQLPPREYVSLFQGGKDLGLQMITAGLATPTPHSLQDKRALNYSQFAAEADIARESKTGMHAGKKGRPAQPAVDLTRRRGGRGGGDKDQKNSAKGAARGYYELMKNEQSIAAVVEYVFSATRMKVRLKNRNVLISVQIQGVSHPKQEAEPVIHAQALDFVRSKVLQRDVQVVISMLDKFDNFLGDVLVPGLKNESSAAPMSKRAGGALSVALLEHGFGTPLWSLERAPFAKQLEKALAFGQQKEAGLFKGYAEKLRKEAEARQQREAKELERSTRSSFAGFRTLEVCSPNSVFALLSSNQQTMETIQTAMQEFSSKPAAPPGLGPQFTPKRGVVCGGLFAGDDGYHRVRIDRVNHEEDGGEGKVRVQFLDYGTVDVLDVGSLRPFGVSEQQIAELPPMAQELRLSGLLPPTDNSGFYDDSGYALSAAVSTDQGFSDLAARIDDDSDRNVWHVTIFPDQKVAQRNGKEGVEGSINLSLVTDGWLRVDRENDLPSRVSTVAKGYEQAEKDAKADHKAIWTYGDVYSKGQQPRRNRGWEKR